MNREQVKEVFKILAYAYPKFEVTKDKVDFWHKMLVDQDADKVMERAEKHVKNNPFPPSISELREPENQITGRYIPRDFDFEIKEEDEW